MGRFAAFKFCFVVVFAGLVLQLLILDFQNTDVLSAVFYSSNRSTIVVSRTTRVQNLPMYIVGKPAGGGVFLTDAIWLPSESKLALIALSAKGFERPTWLGYDLNLTFPYEGLGSPLEITPHLTWNSEPVENCTDIPAESFAGNEDFLLFLVHCKVRSTVAFAELMYNDITLGSFDARDGALNAASVMGFSSRGNPSSVAKTGLSVCIKTVRHYVPWIVDIVRYYRKQGVKHVYMSISQPLTSNSTRNYFQALSKEVQMGFVSISWWESSDVGIFNDAAFTRPKIKFANSALYHSKNYDELMMVLDLDEVPVSMDPTRTSFVEEFMEHISIDACSCFIRSKYVVAEGNKSGSLGERYPHRCNTGFNEKSVAVVKNCDYVGIHFHGRCRPGTRRTTIDSVIYLHFYDLSGNRGGCPGGGHPNITSEFAMFEREGFSMRPGWWGPVGGRVGQKGFF